MDELEAAVARLAETSRTRPATGLHDLESLLSAAADGERRSRENALKTATALHSVTRWMERAEERLDEGQERSAAALAAVARLERSLSRGERSDGDGPSEIDEERARMTERPAAPSQGPIGRRGIDARDEVRIAVAEIRSRQSALDAGRAATPAPRRRPAPHGPVESRVSGGGAAAGDALHDIARLISRLEATGRPAVDRDAAAVAAIREDMGRVQAAIAELATRAEVGALERSVLEFASQVAAARAPDDVAAFQVPIEALQAEVRRLSEAVVSGLPGRLTGDLDHLARRIDAAAGTGLDPSVVSGLSREAAQMRRALADTADPDRVEDLARLLTDVSAQVTSSPAARSTRSRSPS